MLMAESVVNWGGGRVHLRWRPGPDLPAKGLVTSAHGFCFVDGQVLMVQLVQRGWDIPGGHRETGETPEACLQRELQEEAHALAGTCVYLGAAEVDHRRNPAWRPDSPYPVIGYQVYYRVDALRLLPFAADHESVARRLVAPGAVPGLHHEWQAVLQAALDSALAAPR